ncbi:splicing factor, Prp19-binding domain-containing protein [Sporodiniella umbellata]|nr:splicing factor, Prp19-binding domain-containing protein [Sporodiniella umbellata]
MSLQDKKKSVPQPKTPFKRYRAGQVPENYVDELSDSESEQEQEQLPIKSELQFAQKDVQTGIQQTVISEKAANTDRRLRRLQQAQQEAIRPARRHTQEDSDEEDEEVLARDRMRLKQMSLMQQDLEAQHTKEESEGSDEEEEGSSEYESSSEEEQEDALARLPKPVFIPKAKRETILLQEKLAKEQEERERRLEEEIEERKLQSHSMLADELKREQEELLSKDMTDHADMPDDTDGLDEEAEYEAWKLRELGRIKRDREARIAREREEEELERRRALPEDVRLKEDMQRAEESKNKDKGQHTFLQKYYHKGAFYHDPEDEIFTRDYTAPTIDEVRNKELLPEVMQVKNFGLAGRTKYTHLVDQDTSSRDSPWSKPMVKRRRPNADDK